MGRRGEGGRGEQVGRRVALLNSFVKVLGPVPLEPFRGALYVEGFLLFIFFHFV